MQEENHTNMNFLSRLRDLMKERGIKTPTELSKFAEVGWSTAKQWLEGSIPRKHVLHNLASKFRVTSSWLLTGEGSKEPVNLKAIEAKEEKEAELINFGVSLSSVPVLSWAHAGQAMAYEQMPDDYLEPMILPSNIGKRKKMVGLIVDGDSMEPEICHHDNIAIMPEEEPRQGCIVVAKFLHDEGVMIRRYQIMQTDHGKPTRVRMIPKNDFYLPSEHDINEFEWIVPVAAIARKVW